MLPYTKVTTQFAAPTTTNVEYLYNGVMFGKARRLHDLESKEFFVPKDADCLLAAMDLTGNEIVYENYEYPGMVSGNKPDVDTVKGYFKNLKYLSMYKTVEAALLIAGGIIAVPKPDSDVQLGTVVSVSEDMTGSVSIANTGTPDEKVVILRSLAMDDLNNFPIPGTLKLRLALTGDIEVVLSDIPHTLGNEAVGETVDETAAITGEIFVYSADAYLTVESNTLSFDYHTRIISGSLVLGVAPGLASVENKCGAYTVLATPNVWINDYLMLGSRSGTAHANVTGSSALSLTTGASQMSASTIKSTYLDTVPAGGEVVDGSMYAGLILASNDYGDITLEPGAYDTDDFDYRIHAGVAHVAVETAARRLTEGAGDNFQVIQSGSAEELGRILIDPNSISIASRVRDGEGEYITGHAYDDDPDNYPAIDPVAPVANFISGTFYVEYEEIVTSAAVVNTLKLITDYANDADGLEALFGQTDPRNYLGFCIGLATSMGAGGFYIVAVEDGQEAKAYSAISKLQSIFHTLRIADDVSSAFASWIDAENLPRPSRIKIGYQRADIPDYVDRLTTDLDYVGVLSVSTSMKYKFESSTVGVNFNSLGVIPGDTLAFYTDGEVVKELTVESITSTKLTMVERFSRIIAQTEMTAAGSDFTSDLTGRKADPTVVSVKLRNTLTDIVTLNTIDVADDGTPDPLALITAVWSGTGSDILTITAAAGYAFVGTPKVSVIPADETMTGYGIYRLLSVTEKKDLMVALQTSSSPDVVKVLTKNIEYSKGDFSGYLPGYAEAVIPWATKIKTLPHLPLTGFEFDTLDGEFGSVAGLAEYDTDTHIQPLADAGYFVINSIPGGKPFCESDNTCSYKVLPDADQSLLSKITPIRLYGKDTYQVTKKFKGPYNTESIDFLNMVNLGLVALKRSYTDTVYQFLGPLLKSVSDQTVSVSGSTTSITHKISPMDPARYVENTIIVE